MIIDRDHTEVSSYRRDTKQRTAASLTSAATVERRDTWSRIVPDQIFVKDVKR